MRTTLYLFTPIVGFILLTGFRSKTSEESLQIVTTEQLRVTPVQNSKAFPDATLKVQDIQTEETTSPDSVFFKITYNITNFILTECTEDPNTHQMANSQEGQHIHFIIDNHPYVPLYKPEHKIKLTLIDASGQPLNGKNTSVERTIILKE